MNTTNLNYNYSCNNSYHYDIFSILKGNFLYQLGRKIYDIKDKKPFTEYDINEFHKLQDIEQEVKWCSNIRIKYPDFSEYSDEALLVLATAMAVAYPSTKTLDMNYEFKLIESQQEKYGKSQLKESINKEFYTIEIHVAYHNIYDISRIKNIFRFLYGNKTFEITAKNKNYNTITIESKQYVSKNPINYLAFFETYTKEIIIEML
jgi:hypothetical protein